MVTAQSAYNRLRAGQLGLRGIAGLCDLLSTYRQEALFMNGENPRTSRTKKILRELCLIGQGRRRK